MGYIKFDKNQLVNLEYVLNKELIRSNRAGSYASTSIIGCNTRKYHGLLVTPQPQLDNELHVLLSSLDETVIQHEAEFNLALHKYPGGVFAPKGHKYIRDFESDPIPTLIYRVGGVILKKEYLFYSNKDRIMLKYTLLDAHSPTTLRFKPLLAFRNRHSLSKENIYVDTSYQQVENGIKVKMYSGYNPLFMQISKDAEYVHYPHWYYNVEYIREQERGYDYQEDLFAPGFFEVPIKKGESVIFCAGLDEGNPSGFNRSYNNELGKRIPRSSYENSLENSAQQFISKREGKTEICAGFPWFGRWGRDTFIALPGLTLELDDEKTFLDVVNTMVKELNGPLFPNLGAGDKTAYNSVDAPLWFFKALQEYTKKTGEKKSVWNSYKDKLNMILEGFRNGTAYNINMHQNGFIYAGGPGHALTWMDAKVHGKPVTPRTGYQVEINALWYNAIRYCMEISQDAGETEFTDKWKDIAKSIEDQFEDMFWNEHAQCLFDFIDGDYKDGSVRPNQVFALALDYQLVSDEKRIRALDVVKSELLTPRGLRTLSPQHHDYQGEYFGDQAKRDRAYHQGTVWPWLLGGFADAWLKQYGKSGVDFIRKIYLSFEDTMHEHGVGSVAEVYNGNPPHEAHGAISQAWSVSELLRIRGMLGRINN